jgi:hypothetical protein
VGDIDDSSGQGVRYASLTDPDGNTWVLQEMSWRTPTTDHDEAVDRQLSDAGFNAFEDPLGRGA